MTYPVLNRKLIYTGRVFDVASHTVRLPDGQAHAFDVVEHNAAITVVPVADDGNLLFVRQYRVGCATELLELPAGVLQDGEDPALGAARETREETGFAAAQLTPLGGFYMSPGYSTEYMHVFLATGLTPDPLPQDEDEFLELVRIPAAQALEMARSGQLQDGKTIVALVLAQAHLPL